MNGMISIADRRIIMKANKIFFDIYSTPPRGVSKTEYRKFYDNHSIVYIALLDEGIYTRVHRQIMFDLNMHHGCFIEHLAFETEEDVRNSALQFAQSNDLIFVEPETFIKIEQRKMLTRDASALRIAEEMISKS